MLLHSRAADSLLSAEMLPVIKQMGKGQFRKCVRVYHTEGGICPGGGAGVSTKG